MTSNVRFGVYLGYVVVDCIGLLQADVTYRNAGAVCSINSQRAWFVKICHLI